MTFAAGPELLLPNRAVPITAMPIAAPSRWAVIRALNQRVPESNITETQNTSSEPVREFWNGAGHLVAALAQNLLDWRSDLPAHRGRGKQRGAAELRDLDLSSSRPETVISCRSGHLRSVSVAGSSGVSNGPIVGWVRQHRQSSST